MGDDDAGADIIPVDMAVNLIIAVAWSTAMERLVFVELHKHCTFWRLIHHNLQRVFSHETRSARKCCLILIFSCQVIITCFHMSTASKYKFLSN